MICASKLFKITLHWICDETSHFYQRWHTLEKRNGSTHESSFKKNAQCDKSCEEAKFKGTKETNFKQVNVSTVWEILL